MGLERAERKSQHDLDRRLGVDLRKDFGRTKGWAMSRPVESDKFRCPTAGVHEVDERLEAALSARHRRNNRQSRHGETGWWRVGRAETGVRKNGEKANDAFASDRFARGMFVGSLLPRGRHNGTMRAT